MHTHTNTNTRSQVEITAPPLEMMIAGNFTPVPLLMGSVQDEAATFIFNGTQPTNMSQALFKCVVWSRRGC